jgi:Ubiquitin-2 like Rad60 SUMO-like
LKRRDALFLLHMLTHSFTGDGKRVEVEVGDNDTVDHLIAAVPEKERFFARDETLFYKGTQLDPKAKLKSYLIRDGTVIDVPEVKAQGAKSSPSGPNKIAPEEMKSPFFRPRAGGSHFLAPLASAISSGSSQRDAKLALGQSFDDDEYLLDPASYYKRLDTLERSVIEASEFYQVDGLYEPMISYINLEDRFTSLDRDPTVWQRIQRLTDLRTGIDLEKDTAIHFGMSLGKSYLIICRVLDSIRQIRHKGFGEDSFTILIHRETTEGNVAELVAVDKRKMDTFLATIGEAIRKLVDALDFNHNVSNDLMLILASSVVLEDILPACELLLEHFGTPIRRPQAPPPARDVLILCRTLTLILDFGLVSAIGSHASRFDNDYVGRDCSDFTVVPPGGGKIGFRLSLIRLNCLDGFLNHQEVWVFQPLWTSSQVSTEPLSILTSLEAFADTWGPIWAIPAGESAPDYIKQINVGTGIICRNDVHFPMENTVSCHWYSSPRAAILQDKIELWIRRDTKMLIGGRGDPTLKVNKLCTFTLDNLERDFGLNMTPLGTKPSTWSVSERQGGFSFSQNGVGIIATGTQKRLPCITQKQAIWNKWKFQPSRANPHILNSYLGVEISHCTGNSRRVRLRDLFTIRLIKDLLDYQFPDWLTNTKVWWSLREALFSQSDNDIINVWTEYWKYRDQMAEIVCYVLELLEKTGNDAGVFNVAFLNGKRERSMPLDLRLNSWAGFLEDSHLTAVYAIVNEVCLDAGNLNHNLATCESSSFATSAFTVFETAIAIPNEQTSRERLFIDQRGYLQRLSEPGVGVLLVNWELRKIRELGERFGRMLGSRQSQKSSREIQNRNELGGQHFSVLVKSTTQSFGGLPVPRTSGKKEAEESKASVMRDLPQSLLIRAVEYQSGSSQVVVQGQDQLQRSSR